MSAFKHMARRTASALGVDARLKAARTARARTVTVDGHELPPASIRLGGHNFERDRDFLAYAIRDAQRLEDTIGVTASSRVLDIGCGVGRLPIGLKAHFGSLSNYTGVDVDAGSIAWCRKHIRGERVSFIHIDIANERYNPRGLALDDDFRLPLADASFDAIHLYSVFSHMETDDVVAYLREFRRLLSPEGRVFLTAFVEDGVSDIAINPPGYGSFPGEWSGALHCVRYDRAFFERLIHDAGLVTDRYDYASDTDGQSAFFLMLPTPLEN
jgi:SAM-dependent methyltransferase